MDEQGRALSSCGCPWEVIDPPPHRHLSGCVYDEPAAEVQNASWHRVYWGSHGCHLAPGHAEPCACDCCECVDHERDHEAEGCVATWPFYFGYETNFYGEDTPVLPDAKPEERESAPRVEDDNDEWNPTCPRCGFDSRCRECWEQNGYFICHACDAEGRNDD